MELTPFESLTPLGKVRRLRSLVLSALRQYPFQVIDLRLLGMFTNTLFRLRIANGQSLVLRICTPGWRTETDLISEIAWLQALSASPEIGAPRIIPASNGDGFVHASAQGVPEARRCLVMSWIPGSRLGKYLTEQNLFKMGVLFARLHEQSLHFASYPQVRRVGNTTQSSGPNGHPADFQMDFTSRKMDHFLARGEATVLFDQDCLSGLPLHSQQVFLEVKSRVEGAFQRLYADSNGLRVIHNDLWHDNIKIFRGRLYPLDFEDTLWGYPVQDLAMALQDLMMDVPPGQYEPLMNSLRRGYESLLDWPEAYPGEIDLFRLGRMLWVSNYVARFQRQHLYQHIEWQTKTFARYLDTGKLTK